MSREKTEVPARYYSQCHVFMLAGNIKVSYLVHYLTSDTSAYKVNGDDQWCACMPLLLSWVNKNVPTQASPAKDLGPSTPQLEVLFSLFSEFLT